MCARMLCEKLIEYINGPGQIVWRFCCCFFCMFFVVVPNRWVCFCDTQRRLPIFRSRIYGENIFVDPLSIVMAPGGYLIGRTAEILWMQNWCITIDAVSWEMQRFWNKWWMWAIFIRSSSSMTMENHIKSVSFMQTIMMTSKLENMLRSP